MMHGLVIRKADGYVKMAQPVLGLGPESRYFILSVFPEIFWDHFGNFSVCSNATAHDMTSHIVN